MERLAEVAEWLDGPLDDERALVENLRDLRRINRLLGGVALSERAIDRLTDGATPLELLDVGTGAADIPVALLRRARRAEGDLRVVALDSRPEILVAARQLDPRLATTPGLSMAVANGTRLPYPDESFDIGHSSMVVHHLEPDDAVGFLVELRRVSRRGVVVNDLVRGRLNWLGALLLTRTIARGRLTRHDGPLSVLRSYTTNELGDLILRAGMRPIGIERGFGGHRVAIAAR